MNQVQVPHHCHNERLEGHYVKVEICQHPCNSAKPLTQHLIKGIDEISGVVKGEIRTKMSVLVLLVSELN